MLRYTQGQIHSLSDETPQTLSLSLSIRREPATDVTKVRTDDSRIIMSLQSLGLCLKTSQNEHPILLQTLHELSRSHRSTSVLEREHTPLNRVEQNITRREIWIIAPRAQKLNNTALLIILRMAIKEPLLLDIAACRILRQARDVDNAETATVVRLVCESVLHVQVVVDGLDWGLVEARVDWLLEIGDIEDVCSGAAVASRRADAVELVQFVVEEHVGHFFVGDPALVGVGASDVGGLGDDDGVFEVGEIVDGEGVLVETKAHVATLVLYGWTFVDHTLCVVDVAVLTDASWRCWVLRVGDVYRKQPSGAGGVPGILSLATSNPVDNLSVGVGDDVVGRTESSVERNVSLLGEDLWLVEQRVPPWLDFLQLLQVEDLEAVIPRFGADVDVVANDLHITP